LSLLEWQAAEEPALLFETLRVNAAIVQFPPNEIGRLIRLAVPRLHPTDLNRHWASFWVGATYFATSGPTKAGPYLEAALDAGFGVSDGRLVIEAGSLLAVGLILAGRPNEATKLLDRLSAPRFVTIADKRRLQLVRAAALQHLGRHEESDRLLQSGSSPSSSLELANTQALTGFFQSTLGRFRAAADSVSEPLRFARRVGASGIVRTCELTLSYIDAYEAPWGAIERLDQIAEQCRESGYSHLALYATEGAAIACVNVRQFSEAESRLSTALSARRALSFGLTQWDRRRLAPLATLDGAARLLS
jgi:hypothetical protein